MTAAGDPDAWVGISRAVPRRRRGRLPGGHPPGGRGTGRGQGRQGGRMTDTTDTGVTRAEYCAVACAEVFRGDGEVMASAFGTAPALGARLARLTFAPDLVLTDGDAALVDGAPPLGARTGDVGVRVAHAVPPRVRRGVVGSAQPDHDGVADRPHGQPEHQRHRPVGPAEGAAGRRAGRTGQYRQPHHQLLGSEPFDPLVRRAGRRGVRRGLRPGRGGRPVGDEVPRDPVSWSPTSACSTSPLRTGRCDWCRSTPGSPSTRWWSPPASPSSSPTTSPTPGTRRRGARPVAHRPRPPWPT